jgi:hypothetical protein
MRFDPCLDWTHDDYDPLQSSTLPKRYDRFLVRATFIGDTSLGGERARPQQFPDAPPPIESLYWMPE